MVDGPTTEVSLLIPAPIDAVWAVISDPGFPAEHSTELQEAGWAPDSPPGGLGARLVGRNRHPAVGEWSTTSYVVEWDPPRRWSWAVQDPDAPAARWWFEAEPADGGTIVTQRVRLGPGPSGLTPAIEARPDKEERIIERRLAEHRTSMEANLRALRDRLADHGAP